MIINYQHRGKTFRFISKDKKDDSDNIFTVIVGKNGSGKSRLLSSLVSKLLGQQSSDIFYRDSDFDFFSYSITGELNTTHEPTKIIAASTSPFDRFPLIRKPELLEKYSYLGLRDLSSTNFGLSYMAKIVSSLIYSIIEYPNQMDRLNDSMNYLGYTDSIKIKLEYRLTSVNTTDFSNTLDPIESFDFFLKSQRIGSALNRKFFYEQDNIPNQERIYRLFDILRSVPLPNRKSSTTIEIDRYGITQEPSLFNISPKDISFLIDCGALKLKDLELQNFKHKTSYSIINASSGEQSVVMSMLGIASQIKDGALICIDEPEVCLHPEWQEKYIQLLISTFRNYNGCHFLIATHSPQIIAKLESKNCYVLSMESGKAISAKSLINHSADFQLANVFNYPGFKNEYLARIGLNILTKVSTNKIFDHEDLSNFNLLKSQEEFLEETDPVFILLNVLKEMKNKYA